MLQRLSKSHHSKAKPVAAPSKGDKAIEAEKAAGMKLKETVMELSIDPKTLSSKLSQPKAGRGWGESAGSEAGSSWGTSINPLRTWGGASPDDERAMMENRYKFLGDTESFEKLAGPKAKKQATHLSRL